MGILLCSSFTTDSILLVMTMKGLLTYNKEERYKLDAC